MTQTHLSRVYFAGRGLVQVPPEVIKGKILYAHPDGYFVNANGVRIKHDYAPNRYSQVRRGNKSYPRLSSYGLKDCHYLMVCTFFHIPNRAKGEVIDHIDANQLNYSVSNLRITDRPTNDRDGGFLRKLRNKGVIPSMFAPEVLLAYFDRMAEFKHTHTKRQYDKLTKTELLQMLVGPNFVVEDPEKIMEYEMKHHCEC